MYFCIIFDIPPFRGHLRVAYIRNHKKYKQHMADISNNKIPTLGEFLFYFKEVGEISNFL